MADITIYHKPTCSTCRQVIKMVQESGQSITTINYYEQPFSKSALQELLRQAGFKPSDIIRHKEEIYKKLQLRKSQFTDEELLDLMVQYPDLIQRPLIQKGDRVILARPPETISTFL